MPGEIRSFLKSTKWNEVLAAVQFSMNVKIHPAHGFTPFQVVFARNPPSFQDYSNCVDSINNDTLSERGKAIQNVLYPTIRDAALSSATKRAKAYDKTHARAAFKVHDVVMIRDESKVNKMEPIWVGPYKILRKNRGGAFLLLDSTGALLPRNVAPSQMKRIDEDSYSSNSFEVKSILNHRGVANDREYLVQWKHSEVPTWEPFTNFDDLSPIQDYFRRLSLLEGGDGNPTNPPINSSNNDAGSVSRKMPKIKLLFNS